MVTSLHAKETYSDLAHQKLCTLYTGNFANPRMSKKSCKTFIPQTWDESICVNTNKTTQTFCIILELFH
jgi:hypothetical protein